MDCRRTDGQTDRHTDVQSETKIPYHYCVAGYNILELEEFNFNFKYIRLCDLEYVFLLKKNMCVWSGSALSANYPFGDLQTKIG